MSTTQTGLPTCYRHPDRETGLSCSECGRPICTECMTPAAVGIRCPDHAGSRRPAIKAPRIVRRTSGGATEALVTKTLIGLNLLIYVITWEQGAGINSPGGSLFVKWALYGPAVAHGDWWRLITAAFLHASVLHIASNMYFLWFSGTFVEQYLGRARFLALYFVSGLAGSAGALLVNPLAVTVGASGAIFGVLGALFVLERRQHINTGGQVAGLIVINLIITFVFSSFISVGGHVGGLIGGIILMWVLLQYRRSAVLSVAAAVGLAAISIALAYARLRNYSS